jgi:hypothetical protein
LYKSFAKASNINHQGLAKLSQAWGSEFGAEAIVIITTTMITNIKSKFDERQCQLQSQYIWI